MKKEKSIFKILHMTLLSIITIFFISLEIFVTYMCSKDPTAPWYIPFLTLFIISILMGCLYFISLFIYKDAPKHNMDKWMWMFLATFIPNLLGLLLYFIFRKEKKYSRNTACVNCGIPIDSDFKICPYCGTDLNLKCQKCNEKISPNWNICPRCGENVK